MSIRPQTAARHFAVPAVLVLALVAGGAAWVFHAHLSREARDEHLRLLVQPTSTPAAWRDQMRRRLVVVRGNASEGLIYLWGDQQPEQGAFRYQFSRETPAVRSLPPQIEGRATVLSMGSLRDEGGVRNGCIENLATISVPDERKDLERLLTAAGWQSVDTYVEQARQGSKALEQSVNRRVKQGRLSQAQASAILASDRQLTGAMQAWQHRFIAEGQEVFLAPGFEANPYLWSMVGILNSTPSPMLWWQEFDLRALSGSR
jgi:hypothetical protein